MLSLSVVFFNKSKDIFILQTGMPDCKMKISVEWRWIPSIWYPYQLKIEFTFFVINPQIENIVRAESYKKASKIWRIGIGRRNDHKIGTSYAVPLNSKICFLIRLNKVFDSFLQINISFFCTPLYWVQKILFSIFYESHL